MDAVDLFFYSSFFGIVESVVKCIALSKGVVPFQNGAGISDGQFVDLLILYLRFFFAEFDAKLCTQSDDICIGACAAPELSNTYLPKLDKALGVALPGPPVRNICRYVDDFLITYDMHSKTNAPPLTR